MSAEADLTWRSWDGQLVVHHALSNDTHRLSEPAGRVLCRLAGATAQDIAAIGSACDLDEQSVADILAALTELNLVRAC